MARQGKAVFLDRDGVIVREVDYLVKAGQLKVLRGAARALKGLKAAGFKLIVVSNQSAVARRMLTLKGLAAITRRLKGLLEARGASVDAFYYCPHHPDFGDACRCRKPGQELLKRAERRYRLDLKSCFFIGDTTTDMLTAKRAGMPGLLVRTGYGGKDGAYRVKARKTFEDAAAAAEWIIKYTRRS